MSYHRSTGTGKIIPSSLKNTRYLQWKAAVSVIVHYYTPLAQDEEYLIILITSGLGTDPLHLDKVPINNGVCACSGCGSGFTCSEKINFIPSEEFNYRN